MISFAYAALWIFVFSLPWENLTASGGVNIISRLMGAVAAGLAVLGVVISGRLRRWHLLHVAALLFVSWASGCLLLFQTDKLPGKLYTFVQLALVLWIIWELAPAKGRQLGLLTAYVFGDFVVYLDTLQQYRCDGDALLRSSYG